MMRTCDEFERIISDQLDSELPEAEARALSKHLRDCASCREFADSCRRVRDVIQRLPQPTEAASVLPSQRTVNVPWWQRRLSVPIPVAAGIAILLIGGWTLLLRTPETPAGRSRETGMVQAVEVIRVKPAVAQPKEPETTDSVMRQEES